MNYASTCISVKRVPSYYTTQATNASTFDKLFILQKMKEELLWTVFSQCQNLNKSLLLFILSLSFTFLVCFDKTISQLSSPAQILCGTILFQTIRPQTYFHRVIYFQLGVSSWQFYCLVCYLYQYIRVNSVWLAFRINYQNYIG